MAHASNRIDGAGCCHSFQCAAKPDPAANNSAPILFTQFTIFDFCILSIINLLYQAFKFSACCLCGLQNHAVVAVCFFSDIINLQVKKLFVERTIDILTDETIHF